MNIGSIIIFCFVDAMCSTNSLTWNHGRFTGVYLWLYVCLPLLSRSYVFLYCCWRLWKHKTVCRSYTRCNIDSRAPAQESKLRQPQALQQVMWRPGPGQQSQRLQVCHPTRTGTTLSWQAQLLPWVAWVGIYCQSLRSRRRLSTEEGVVNAICGWSALYFTMVYFLRIDLHLLEIIVEMYSTLLVLRPVASPNLEVCTRDVQ